MQEFHGLTPSTVATDRHFRVSHFFGRDLNLHMVDIGVTIQSGGREGLLNGSNRDTGCFSSDQMAETVDPHLEEWFVDDAGEI